MRPVTVKEKDPDNRGVFSGWKDIAAYLGKGTRTVQRYERTLRLPVRRVGGKTRGSVLAIKAELDLWVSSAPARESAETQGISLRAAENERERLLKTRARGQKLWSETQQLRAEISVLREAFSNQMRVIRASLASSEPTNRLSSPDFILDRERDLALGQPELLPPPCSICDSSVRLESANTDETGRAVHEKCYLLKIKVVQMSSPQLHTLAAVRKRPGANSGEIEPLRRLRAV